MRQGEDGRTQIESITLFLEHIELAADPRVFLVDRDIISFLCQRDGCGQSSKAGADDNDAILAHDVRATFLRGFASDSRVQRPETRLKT